MPQFCTGMPPSTSLPPSNVAQKIHIDMHRTNTNSPAGKYIGIRYYDEMSGDIGFNKAKEDCKSINIFNAIVDFLVM